MASKRFVGLAGTGVDLAIQRASVSIGRKVHEARMAKRWNVRELARRARVSIDLVYLVERGETASVEGLVRLGWALGMRIEIDLVDPRKRAERPMRMTDPVHSLMGEFEAKGLRMPGYGLGLDEPYQHYQFAGRADLVAWDLEAKALLHIENRTRFPDFQEMAGSFNAKRAYLGTALAERLGLPRWESETHVVAAIWSSEVLHAIRLRPDSFRSLCPDPLEDFEAWWMGRPPFRGKSTTMIVLDPLATIRQRRWIGLDEAISGARPRHRGYADVVAKMAEAA